jgi:hypothetical protein
LAHGFFLSGGEPKARGPFYWSLAGETHAVMALLAVVGAASAILLMRRWQGERVVGSIQVQPHSAVGGGKTEPEI